MHLLISIVVLGFLLTSCAAIRGYFNDGKDGRVYQRVKIKSKVFALSALFRNLAIENREDTNARHKKDCKSFVLLSTFSYLCICNTRIGVNE